MTTLLQDVEERLFSGGSIDRDAALALTEWPDKPSLYRLADKIRRHFMGDRFDACAIINAKSGNCMEDCRFCAQSARHRTEAPHYAFIDKEEALRLARDCDAHGVERIGLVTSGRKLNERTLADMERLFAEMARSTGLYLCSSAGLLDEATVSRLAAAGLKRYHCNLEACKNYFPQVCTTHTWEEKAATLRLARAHGLALCSGGIIGMGESIADRVDLALELRDLGVMSIAFNVLTPIPGTPLAHLEPLALDEVLTAIAVFRLINPKAVLRMCGGRQQLGKDQYRCFTSGANGAIVGNYLTTNGNELADDLARIKALGFTLPRETAGTDLRRTS
ncbi:MAG: biotin synthase BioB [Deltaproteobacteria bacterium]|nr:biotin synthase BioB [Deltaproteobacteria bacterium]MCR5219688.1 biotin synthase BioB [bacterium]